MLTSGMGLGLGLGFTHERGGSAGIVPFVGFTGRDSDGASGNLTYFIGCAPLPNGGVAICGYESVAGTDQGFITVKDSTGTTTWASRWLSDVAASNVRFNSVCVRADGNLSVLGQRITGAVYYQFGLRFNVSSGALIGSQDVTGYLNNAYWNKALSDSTYTYGIGRGSTVGSYPCFARLLANGGISAHRSSDTLVSPWPPSDLGEYRGGYVDEAGGQMYVCGHDDASPAVSFITAYGLDLSALTWHTQISQATYGVTLIDCVVVGSEVWAVGARGDAASAVGDAILIKFNLSTGAVVDQYTYTIGGVNGRFNRITRLVNGNILVAGWEGSGTSRVMLVACLDTTAAVVWAKTLTSGTGDNRAEDVCATSDGAFWAVGGGTASGATRGQLVRGNADGTLGVTCAAWTTATMTRAAASLTSLTHSPTFTASTPTNNTRTPTSNTVTIAETSLC